MDRKTTIGYVLMFVLFILFFYFNQKNVADIEREKQIKDSIAKVNTPEQKQVEITKTDTSKIVIPDTAKESIYTLNNDKLKLNISSKGGIVKYVNLVSYKKYDSTDAIIIDKNHNEFGFVLNTVNGVVETKNLNFSVIEQSNSVLKLKANIGKGAMVLKYELVPGQFNLKYQVNIENASSFMPNNQNYIDGYWNLQINRLEKGIDDERSKTTIYYKYNTDDEVENLSETSNDDEKLQKNIQWISYKQKFFNTTLICENGISDESKVEVVVPDDDTTMKLLKSNFTLSLKNETNNEFNFTYFIGPNHFPTLSAQKVELQKIIPLGFFGWVSRYAIIPLFNWLASFLNNYGLIILLLTIIIKLVLFPLVYKSYVSSAKMRLLKPEMEEIKSKFDGDMTRIQQENMKLYKRAGVSPFGGCFPMLLQIPILIAMFNFFPSSIELRQKSFLWANDLSTFDNVLNLGFHIPGYGSHVSLFTLLMTISTLLYTRMNNQLTGVSGQMKWISYFMPILFLGFFNNYASGLTYYYFVANMITFTQNWFISKFIVDEDKLHKQIEENKKKPVVVKKSSFQQKLEDYAKKRGIQAPNNKNIKK